jgi:Domain of unknown function (DUF1330)
MSAYFVVELEITNRPAMEPDGAAFWYNSPEYQKILPDRLDNSTGRAFIVEDV